MAVAILTAANYATLQAAGLTFPLQSRWTSTFPAPPNFEPAYDAAHAYVALRDNQLVAVALDTGKTVWSVACPMSAAPAAGDGLVFAGGDGFVEARAQLDGTSQWRTPIEGVTTRLYWDTGWLIAATDRGALLAIRAADGEVLWRRDLGVGLQGAPAPAGNRLYLSLTNAAMMALSLQTGESIWTSNLPAPGSGILALDDRLFVGSLDNNFYCLSAKDGSVRWSWRTGADVIGAPVIDTKRVYFLSLDNVLRALDRNSGSLRWLKSLSMRPSTGPLLTGTTLIVAGVGTELHAFSTADGSAVGNLVLRSAQDQEMQLAAPPYLTAENLLIVLTRGGQMQALSGAPPPAVPAVPAVPVVPATVPAVP